MYWTIWMYCFFITILILACLPFIVRNVKKFSKGLEDTDEDDISDAWLLSLFVDPRLSPFGMRALASLVWGVITLVGSAILSLIWPVTFIAYVVIGVMYMMEPNPEEESEEV